MKLLKLQYLLVCIFAVAGINTQAAENPDLPRVLIIGDSISIGYTKPLKKILKGKANVLRHRGNAQHSGNGIKKLDEWLGKKSWDVIHFNHGLHDLKFVDDKGKITTSKKHGHIQVPIKQYEKNMEIIVMRLKKTGAKLIFATSTPFPEPLPDRLRECGKPELYNQAALRVMKKHNIAVNDLYRFVKPRLRELQIPKDAHFTKEGSAIIAKEVAKQILPFLNQRRLHLESELLL